MKGSDGPSLDAGAEQGVGVGLGSLEEVRRSLLGGDGDERNSLVGGLLNREEGR